ncbi:Ubiquitin and WLM domain-containing metalloprotease [Teratosphaeria destructans]|uniref:Ubiquitin and WLM domain-containing metalloprotease n=1 Tax=Teratosphaeria destructans TaxID=418781 RepID=A0A9W7W3W4_9PEZI|nr:Ubiquitin and WLM domain-containing metalloprotease [Teratosphaeria destructans]
MASIDSMNFAEATSNEVLNTSSQSGPPSTSDAASDIDEETRPEPAFELTVQLHGKPIELPFHDIDATLQDLSDAVAEDLHIPPSNQKFLISPKIGLLKSPFKNPEMPLRDLKDKKVVLMGATTAEVAELESDIAERKARMGRRQQALREGRKVKANQSRDWEKVQDEARYTFHMIQPLPYLPNPEKSQRFLERLANDAGIKASMRKHGFSVGLLTEMNPAEHTTHESKTLGLNRNRGEVIELRLRTDAYDGYRDYKVIRKTLCHELTHNVWGAHDRNFWDLCREIEREVERNDWRRGGHSVGGEEFYNPGDEGVDGEADEGGWEGGEYVLGGGTTSGASSASGGGEALSRREIMARAAEERMRRQNDAKSAEQGAKEGSSKSA